MKLYFQSSVAYFLLAVTVVYFATDDGSERLMAVWKWTAGVVPIYGKVALILTLTGLVLAALKSNRSKWKTVLAVAMAFIATLLFQSGFTLMKTSLPDLVPFYADTMLANLDMAMLGGQDAWVFAHKISAYLPMDFLSTFYLQVWVWPALCLPLIVAAFDPDQQRVRRTMILYLLGWVLIGNVMALSGMSVGPIFYDRVLGTTRFADLAKALVDAKQFGFLEVQSFLWDNYVGNRQSIGSGISAFPSVHVSIAMVSALYLGERFKFLAPVGAAFVVVILFLSVYSGYHYAIDGFVSIAVMGAVWFWLRRKQHAVSSEANAITQPA